MTIQAVRVSPPSERINPPLAGSRLSAVTTALQAELDASLEADARLPGIIATINAPRFGLAWSGSCGVVEHGATNALSPAHAFRIASATKPFTAAVALRLFEQGRLELFAPIAPLLPRETHSLLEAGGYEPDRITIYHLLTHSSGLRDHAGLASSFVDTLQRHPAHEWTHAEQIASCMAMGPPLAPPGVRFAYSDTAYVILGDILERVADKPLHVLMRELLQFEALGLTQTYFERHEAAPRRQKRAGQYLGELNIAGISCSCDLSGGGGLVSTTEDLATFYRAAALGTLFDYPETLALALTTPSLHHAPPSEALHSALMRGRVIGQEPSWMHGGAWGVVAAYFPARDIALALSFNQALAGEATLGVWGDITKPSIADRLALIVQRAATIFTSPGPST